MGIFNINPWGKKKYLTGVSSRVTDQTKAGVTSVFSDLLLICPAMGGNPNPLTGYGFTSPESAAGMLRDEPVAFTDGYQENPVEIMRKAWTPSPDPAINGADLINMQIVGAKTQAQWELLDAGANAVAVIKFRHYGTLGNRAKVAVATGTALGYKVTGTFDGESEVLGDNLGAALYVRGPGGIGSLSSLLTITRSLYDPKDGSADEDRAIQLVIVSGGAVVRTLNLLHPDYATIAAVAAAIAEESGWEAYVGSGVDPDLPSYYLDPQTALDVSGQDTLIDANIGSLIYALRGHLLFIAEKKASALGVFYTAPTTTGGFIPPTTPGTYPIASYADWTTTIDRSFEAFNKPLHVILGTTDRSVILYLSSRMAHYKRQGGRRLWKAFVGHSASYTQDEIKDLRRAINNYDVCLVSPEVYDTDLQSGIEVDRSSLYAAAALAGMRVGNYRMSLTNKLVNFTGVVRNYTEAEKDGAAGLIANRVTVLEPVESADMSGIRVQRALTTYAGGSKDSDVLEFVSWVKWYIQAYFQTNMERNLGLISDPNTDLQVIHGEAIGLLEGLTSHQSSQPLLIANPNNPIAEPAYRMATPAFDEGALNFNMAVGSVSEIGWININIGFTVRKVQLTG